jgi:hypothetical protein
MRAGIFSISKTLTQIFSFYAMSFAKRACHEQARGIGNSFYDFYLGL